MNYWAIPGLKLTAKANHITDIAPLVIDKVGTYYSIPGTLITGLTREQCVITARHVCFYILRKKFFCSYKSIANYFGKDHSTVIYAVGKMDNLMSVYPELKRDVSSCRELLSIDFAIRG